MSRIQLGVATTEYQKIQADLSNIVEARQRLDAQRSENELVQKVIELFMTFKLYLLNLAVGIPTADSRQYRLQANRTCSCEARPRRGKGECPNPPHIHRRRDV